METFPKKSQEETLSEKSSSDENSLGKLLVRLVDDFSDLLKVEINNFKEELITKAKKAAVGIALLVGTVVLILFGFSFLLWAFFWALTNVVSFPVAAIIVALTLMVLAVIVAILGRNSLKKGFPPLPAETIHSVKEDVEVTKEALHS